MVPAALLTARRALSVCRMNSEPELTSAEKPKGYAPLSTLLLFTP